MATMDISTVSSSGNNGIDSLLNGTRWQSTSISYSFPETDSTFPTDYSDDMEYQYNFQPFSTAMRSGIRQALSAWAAVSGFTFTEITEPASSGVIRIGQSSKPSTAWSYYPVAVERGGDAWFGYRENYSLPQWQTYSNYAFAAGMLHELGHSLGLKHPGNYSSSDVAPFIDSANDAIQYSVMSYRSYPGDTNSGYVLGNTSYPQTPMRFDIAAIQYMYGANYNYNSGNTTYTFSPNDTKIFRTVWDGGGIDTYDASAYTEKVEIQLEPGAWTKLAAGQLADLGDSKTAPGSVCNAYLYQSNTASLIENAIGGSGDDVLRGYTGNNDLSGGAGCDQLWGWTGNNSDTLTGGLGDDAYWWGENNGHDIIAADDYMQLDVLRLYNVTAGTHTTANNAGDLRITTSDSSTVDVKNWYAQDAATRLQCFVFSDNVAYAWNNGRGASVNLYDAVYENAIHVAIGGSAEEYCLRGTSVADTLTGGAAADQIWGGNGGNDRLAGRAGSDTYWFTADAGTDTVVASSDNSEDTVRLNTSWQPSDVAVTQVSSDLQLVCGSTKIVLESWGLGGGYRLNTFYFGQTGGTYRVDVSSSGDGQFVQIG